MYLELITNVALVVEGAVTGPTAHEDRSLTGGAIRRPLLGSAEPIATVLRILAQHIPLQGMAASHRLVRRRRPHHKHGRNHSKLVLPKPITRNQT